MGLVVRGEPGRERRNFLGDSGKAQAVVPKVPRLDTKLARFGRHQHLPQSFLIELPCQLENIIPIAQVHHLCSNSLRVRKRLGRRLPPDIAPRKFQQDGSL